METNLFSLTVQCPALTQNAVTSVEKYIPSPSAPAKVKVVTGIGGYAQTTSTHSSCAIQGFVLKAGGATYSGSWLVITSQGNVEVDTNIIGVQSSLTVDFTYGGTSYTTSSFKIEVKCPSLTASSISNFNKDLSNTALIEVIVNAGFVSGGSTDMATCTVSYQVVKAADNSPLGGTWLTLGAGGKIQLNRQILGSETVKIKYTQNGVDAFTNAFSVTVACPSISSVTPNALYSYDIPNTAATSDTTVLPSSGYINNPSTMSACALTLTLVEASDGTTPIVGWLTIDGAGTIKVNTNALGDKTAKVKIKRPSTTPPIDQISGQFQVIVKCPQIS